MKIIVAGASGAVGRLLLPELVAEGHDVVGWTRSAGRLDAIERMGTEARIVDVFDREAVFAAVREARPDAIIHQLTALGNRNFADNSRIRIEGTRHLVDAALAAGVRRIVAQSIAWAYAPGEGLATEEEPLDLDAQPPRQGMVAGVAALETAAGEMPEHVVLRYGLFYGPGTWYARGGYMAEQAHAGLLPATGGVASFVHVADAARAARLALGWPSGAYNVVDDEPAPGTEWLPSFAGLLGAPAPEAAPGGAAAWERGASNAKARRLCGWEPLYSSWREGFARSLGAD